MSQKPIILPGKLSTFKVEKSDGESETFYIVLLDRLNRVKRGFEDHYIDFVMEYYVKKEPLHYGTGIYKSEAAMKEYRDVLKNRISDPSYHSLVCYRDDGTKPFIIGGTTVKLVTNGGNWDENIEFKTAELQKIAKIRAILARNVSVEDLCNKYSVESFYYARSIVVHSAYESYGVAFQLALTLLAIGKQYNIEMLAAWATAWGTQTVSQRLGLNPVGEIKSEDIEKQLDIAFPKGTPNLFKMYVFKVNYRSKY